MAEEHGTDWPRGVQKMPALTVNRSLCAVAPYVRHWIHGHSVAACLVTHGGWRACRRSMTRVAIEVLDKQMAQLKSFMCACIYARTRMRASMQHVIALHKCNLRIFCLKMRKEKEGGENRKKRREREKESMRELYLSVTYQF